MSNHSSESKNEEPKQYGAQNQTNLKLSNTIVTQWLLNNYESAEGSSLPRRVVYAHYVNFCKTSNLEQQNPASFGKLIRGIFPNLKTRRLGTRGNSKYHYYGVRIKASSDLRIPTYDIDNPIISHTKDVKYENNNNNIKFSPSKPNPADYLHHSFYPQHELPQISIQITDFAISNTGNMHQNASNSFASLANVYHTFAGQFLHSVYSQSISEIEKLVRFYFMMISTQYKELFEYPEVTSFILAKDQIIYKSIYHLLFASILRSISSPNIYFITYFVKNYVAWIEGTMGELPMEFVQQKISMAKEFSILLQKMANINHFAHLLKGVFNTPMLIGQMYEDLEKIDVKFILQQIPFIDSPTDSFFLRFFDDFKETLKEKMNIEMIAMKLCNHFDRYVESIINSPSSSPISNGSHHDLANGSSSSSSGSSNGSPSHSGNGNGVTSSSSSSNGNDSNGTDHQSNDRIKAIYNEAVSKFSYYSNSIITDLTIKNAGSFSSFHIFRIFLEEFLSYYILKKSSNLNVRLSSVINNDLPSSVVIITANNNDIHSSSSSLSSSTSSSLSMTSSLTSTSALGGFDSLNQSKEKQLLHDEYRWSLSTPTLLDPNNSSSNLLGGSSHISGDSHPLYHPSLSSSSMDISIEKSTGNINTSSPNQTSFISSSSTSTRLYHQPLSSSTLSNMNTNTAATNTMNQPTLPMINSGGNEGMPGGRRMAIVGISNPPYQTLPFIPRSSDPNNNPMTNNTPFPNNNNNSLLNVINNNNPSSYLPSNTSMEMRDKIALNAVNSNSISSRSNNMNNNMNNNNNNNNDDQPKNFQQPGWKSAFNWQIPHEYSDRASTAFLDLDDKDSRPLSSAKKKKLD